MFKIKFFFSLPQTPFMKTALNDFTCTKEVMKKFNFVKDLSLLYYNRGICYFNRKWCNDEIAALRDFLYCLQLQPSNSDAHFALLKILKNLGQLKFLENYLELYKKRFDLNEELKIFIDSIEVFKSKLLKV